MELLFRDDPYLRECEAVVVSVDDDGVRLDRTVFYPTGGGQPGDSGRLRRADGEPTTIVEARKGSHHQDVVHVASPDSPLPEVGERVVAEIDWERRYRHMRMHTCLHLLCSLIEGEVTGGQIGTDKGRFDFNLPDTRLDKETLTEQLNSLIAGDHPVAPRWIDDEALARSPELVRTMSVRPPTGSGQVRLIDIAGVDLQPCGGTHVQRTGEIGAVAVGKIENKGKQNRRVNIRFA